MSSGIFYNRQVTAADVNDLAKDLGNTSFNGFGTEKFGTDELNGITKSLVGKGVLTSDNMCRTVVSDGKVYIQTGTIVFANGAKKVIASPVELPLTNGNYIYALNNISAGTCSIVEAEALPETGDFVALAQIASDGTVKSIAEIAKAKMTLYAGNNEVNKSVELAKSPDYYGYSAVSFLHSEWSAHSYILIIFTESDGDKYFSFVSHLMDITLYDEPLSYNSANLPSFYLSGNRVSAWNVYYYFLRGSDKVEMRVFPGSSAQGVTVETVLI